MFERRIPEWVRHAPAPGVRGFAVLSGLEACARGILVSVYPIAMYRALEDAETVSEFYFLIGIASLAAALLTPGLARVLPRRYVYSIGTLMLAGGGFLAAQGGPFLVPLGLGMTTIAVVVMFVCLNAYVMDYVERSALGECETLRMYYSALAWTVGPFLGIWLMNQWAEAPFYISVGSSLLLLGVFWAMRLGNGKQISRATGRAPNPLAYLPRFLAQPRLVAGWTFAVLRSCAWWVYVVYLPIYAVEQGYSEQLGGIILSITNGLLFATPLMLRWMRRTSVRHAVRTGFAGGAVLFLAGTIASGTPPVAIGCLMLASGFLILLDISAGLPFLMAVRPNERTEMSAVYSTYRDVSGIITPGVARAILGYAPLSAVFAAAAVGLGVCCIIAGWLHPRLGQRRALAPSLPDPQATPG